MLRLCFYIITVSFLTSCSVQNKIHRTAEEKIIDHPALQNAHVGIAVFDVAANKFLYDYQGEKYFVPASNIKIATLYAAMKYLGDSLVGARIARDDDGALLIFPAGDPSFLHPDFLVHPLYNRIKNEKIIRWNLTDWKSQHWGNGWSWNDFDASYMAERSPMPLYGNLLKFNLKDNILESSSTSIKIFGAHLDTIVAYDTNTRSVKSKNLKIDRALDENIFYLAPSTREFDNTTIPFKANPLFISKLLNDTLKTINVSTFTIQDGYNFKPPKEVVHSQSTDSLLKPMMHRSDNFFAEQSLLMVSNEFLGVMNDSKIIDTILKTDFKDLPQKPRWVDGSGLSRYNLFSPKDFISILNKIKNEFGMERVKEIFPTGNDGTLTNYYVADSGYIFAKTGTLSGVVALSGFLYTHTNKLLLFSVLVNNHQASAPAVRRAVESFLMNLRRNY